MPTDRHGYLLLREEDVPDTWRARAVPLLLVPLLPEEAAEILVDRKARPSLRPEEERLARLLAEGYSVSSIARELGRPLRTVQRQLAQLRQSFGAASTNELATDLARRGFSGGEHRPTDDAGGATPEGE